MKKLLTFILLIALVCSCLTAFTACQNTPPEDPPEDPTESAPKISVAALTASTHMPEDGSSTESAARQNGKALLSTAKSQDATYSNAGFFAMEKGSDYFYLTVRLNNAEDVEITELSLSCENEDLIVHLDKDDNITVKAGEKATIPWPGSGNHYAFFQIALPDSDVSVDTITVSDLYGTHNGKRVAVDLNGKNVLSVYKADEIIGFSDRKNTTTDFSFQLKKAENCTVTSVTLDQTPVEPDANGRFHITKNGFLLITYEYRINDELVYKDTLFENVALMEFRFIGNRDKDSSCIVKKPESVWWNEDGSALYDVSTRLELHFACFGTDDNVYYLKEYPNAVQKMGSYDEGNYYYYSVLTKDLDTLHFVIAGIEYTIAELEALVPVA